MLLKFFLNSCKPTFLAAGARVGAGASEKIPGARKKQTGSATLVLLDIFLYFLRLFLK